MHKCEPAEALGFWARLANAVAAMEMSSIEEKGTAMATMITEEFINCSACEPECPNQTISEGDGIYVIDPERCTECVGFHGREACQEACPVECCVPDPNNGEVEELLLGRARKLHPDIEFPPLEALPANLSRFRQ